MCHARDLRDLRDLRMFADRKQTKVEDMQFMQDRRAGVIDTLLSDANKHSEKTKPEAAPIKEVAPAK